MRRLLNGIGELAFETYRCVGQYRHTRETFFPFAKHKPIRNWRLAAKDIRDLLLTRRQRVHAEMARVVKSRKTRACPIDADEKRGRSIADAADRRGGKTVALAAKNSGDDAYG